MSYVRTLTICLLLVYFVSAVGCHCFDLDTCGMFLFGWKVFNVILTWLCGGIEIVRFWSRCV